MEADHSCMRSVTFAHSPHAVTVGKILCLGRNYVAHAAEMGAEVPPLPVVFLKPSSALPADPDKVRFPAFAQELHHEVELVVLIGRGGKHISRQDAMEHVAGYAVGLDMTLRDLQAEAKKKGLPWTVAKAFDDSAPLSPFVGPERIGDPHELVVSLRVNGTVRQRSSTGLMIFRIPEIIAYLSTVFTLDAGDLIFTGTPEGVGPVARGDVLEAELEGLTSLRVEII
jgi:acylpyruvate hydrolase